MKEVEQYILKHLTVVSLLNWIRKRVRNTIRYKSMDGLLSSVGDFIFKTSEPLANGAVTFLRSASLGEVVDFLNRSSYQADLRPPTKRKGDIEAAQGQEEVQEVDVAMEEARSESMSQEDGEDHMMVGEAITAPDARAESVHQKSISNTKTSHQDTVSRGKELAFELKQAVTSFARRYFALEMYDGLKELCTFTKGGDRLFCPEKLICSRGRQQQDEASRNDPTAVTKRTWTPADIARQTKTLSAFTCLFRKAPARNILFLNGCLCGNTNFVDIAADERPGTCVADVMARHLHGQRNVVVYAGNNNLRTGPPQAPHIELSSFTFAELVRYVSTSSPDSVPNFTFQSAYRHYAPPLRGRRLEYSNRPRRVPPYSDPSVRASHASVTTVFEAVAGSGADRSARRFDSPYPSLWIRSRMATLADFLLPMRAVLAFDKSRVVSDCQEEVNDTCGSSEVEQVFAIKFICNASEASAFTNQTRNSISCEHVRQHKIVRIIARFT